MITKPPLIKHLRYRPDIDGLRAIAVLMVIGFHYFPSRMPFGFIGVDIFFVISGYLITQILISRSLAHDFKLKEFYISRVKRIFPALIVILFICLVFGWFSMLPSEYSQLGKHIATASTFTSNFLLLNESGYFDIAAEVKPLLHLWSLSIEEQFYLFWPLIIYFSSLLKKVNLLTILISLWCLSFATGIYFSFNHPSAGFYLPISRFWELISGGILASIVIKDKIGRSPSLNKIISAGGLILLASSFWLISKENVYPSYWAILPVLATFFILLSHPNTFLNNKILSHGVLVKIGLISYPLYLWHWPLLVFLNFNISSDISKLRLLVYKLMSISLSFLLAYLTYRFIESPIRKPKRQNSFIAVKILLTLQLMLGISAFFIIFTNGAEFRIPESIRPLLFSKNMSWEHYVRFDECHLQEDKSYKYANICFEKKKPIVVLWGDSHASTLYPTFSLIQQKAGFGLDQFTKAGCPPLRSENIKDYYCTKNYDQTFVDIEKIQPEYIFIASAWFLRPSIYPKSYEELEKRLNSTLSALRYISPKSRIVIIGPLPRWHVNPLRTIYISWLNKKDISIYQPAEPLYELNDVLQNIAKKNKVEFISIARLLCKENKCISRVDVNGWEIISDDYGHLSYAGAMYVGSVIQRQVNKIMRGCLDECKE